MAILHSFAAGIAAALIAIIIIPLLVPAARRCRLVDRPGGRKQHSGEVPLVGGLAIYACVAGIAVVDPGIGAPGVLAFLVLAGGAVTVGLVDDWRGLRPTIKLALQFVIAALAVSWGGHFIGGLGNIAGVGDIPLGRAAPIVSAIGYVALMNGINLIDGADGVAGIASAVILTAMIALMAAAGGRVPVLPIAVLGAVLGFLVYNMPWPGRRRPMVFLGDAGSMGIGFALGWSALDLHHSAPQLPPVLLAWILSVPVIDMAAVAISRMRRGRSPFTPGRDHLHHLLLDRGVSAFLTALAIGAITLAFVAAGIAGHRLGLSDAVLCAVLATAATAYGVLTHRLRAAASIRDERQHGTRPTVYWAAGPAARSAETKREEARRARAA